MVQPKHELKAEALRLRKEEKLSYKEILRRLPVSKGSLSAWLREVPLTCTEQKASRSRTRTDKGVPRKFRGEESKHHRLLSGATLSRIHMARLSQAAVEYRLCLHGFRFFRPNEGDCADFLVETVSGKFCSVQVKTARRGTHGLPQIPLRNSAGGHNSRRYRAGEFDFIIGYDLYTDTCHVFSWQETEEKRATLTITAASAEAWSKLRASSL